MTHDEEMALLRRAAIEYVDLGCSPGSDLGPVAKELCRLLNRTDLSEVENAFGPELPRTIERKTDARRAMYLRAALHLHGAQMAPDVRALADELLAQLSL